MYCAVSRLPVKTKGRLRFGVSPSRNSTSQSAHNHPPPVLGVTAEISEKRRKAYLSRLEPWVSGASVSLAECASVLSVLNHCTRVAIPAGHSHLSSLQKLSASLSTADPRSKGVEIPASALHDVNWWRKQLKRLQPSNNTSSVIPLPAPPPPAPTPTPHTVQISVDASMSWGVGVFIDGRWLAWKFRGEWSSNDRDINWAEMIAVELSLRSILAKGPLSHDILIFTDSQTVRTAYDKGGSSNTQQDFIMQQIYCLRKVIGVDIKLMLVESKKNLADELSRGKLPSSSEERFAHAIPLPPHLAPFLEPM